MTSLGEALGTLIDSELGCSFLQASIQAGGDSNSPTRSALAWGKPNRSSNG